MVIYLAPNSKSEIFPPGIMMGFRNQNFKHVLMKHESNELLFTHGSPLREVSKVLAPFTNIWSSERITWPGSAGL